MDEMATPAVQWWCPLGPIATQAEGPGIPQDCQNIVSKTGISTMIHYYNLYLYYVRDALCHDSGHRCSTRQGDCIRVKDKALNGK